MSGATSSGGWAGATGTGGGGAGTRHAAVATAAARSPRGFDAVRGAEVRRRVSDRFGVRTFDLRRMRERLPSQDYARLLACLESGGELDRGLAAAVAHAAKEWAIENGASHFCHWFQPLTGATAEKHDAFLSFSGDGNPIESFSWSQLVQSEPDASSFPSGGMRTTFEARGYTAWDPSSPMFLMTTRTGTTLCIPSAYLSYTGDALDEKTPLLRSIEALRRAVSSMCATLEGRDDDGAGARVVSTVGPEQEYFLVDRAFTPLRPDLLLAGRTLLGAPPAKGQQLDDHYFGSIPPRVTAFMSDFENELYELGVPVKTRHNEVAPGQFEMAPIFEEAQVAADHNQLAMEVMRRVARRHDFDVYFHEKPFAGINGSGKHLNWSLALRTPSGAWSNLFEPSDQPSRNVRFLMMTAAVQKAVLRHAGALRAAISGSGNDHRLGANEAPPAIVSVFLGATLTRIFDRLAEGAHGDHKDPAAELISLGVTHLPEVRRDNTDRNRTSPFAFTGNKWEFRACGSSMPVSFPITLLNAAVAEAVTEMDSAVRERVEKGAARDESVLEVLCETAAQTAAVRFEGNNYSEEWVAEAESRGLPNLRKTPDALAHLADPANHAFLVEQNVLSAAEVAARLHVRVERYVMDLDIEVRALLDMVDRSVLPAASSYLHELCCSVQAVRDLGFDAGHRTRASELAEALADLTARRAAVVSEHESIDEKDELDKARRYAYELMPAMERLRETADRIETLCADHHWPLPRYSEMLFIR